MMVGLYNKNNKTTIVIKLSNNVNQSFIIDTYDLALFMDYLVFSKISNASSFSDCSNESSIELCELLH